MSASDSRRRFNEQEVALIIQRASEQQHRDSSAADASTGMSLADLEQVAREAGLDPAAVRRAALDLDATPAIAPASRLLGAPTVLRVERTVDGEPLLDDYEGIAAEIQRILGGTGTATTLGRTLQWTSGPASRAHGAARAVQVSVTPRNGRTTVRAEEQLGHIAGGLYGGIVGGVGLLLMPIALRIAFGQYQSGVLAVGLAAAVFASLYGVARVAYTTVARSREDRLRTLVHRLASLAG